MATEQEIAAAQAVLAATIRSELTARLETWRAELAVLEDPAAEARRQARMTALRGLIAIGESDMLTMLPVAPLPAPAQPEPQPEPEPEPEL